MAATTVIRYRTVALQAGHAYTLDLVRDPDAARRLYDQAPGRARARVKDPEGVALEVEQAGPDSRTIPESRDTLASRSLA
jgi:hypothetical protein